MITDAQIKESALKIFPVVISAHESQHLKVIAIFDYNEERRNEWVSGAKWMQEQNARIIQEHKELVELLKQSASYCIGKSLYDQIQSLITKIESK